MRLARKAEILWCLFFVEMRRPDTEIGCLAWLCSRTSGVRDRRTADYATRQWSPGKVLPPRLLGVGQTRYYFTTGWEIGCRGWNCTSIRAFKGRCPTIGRPGKWWPARVTRPVLRIKSPLHHFNACRPNWCSRQDLHPHWRRSRRRVSALDYASKRDRSLQPVMLRQDFLYKRNPQASAWRRNGRSPQCCPGPGWLMTPA